MEPTPGLPAYAELRCVSTFSFLVGASQPEELVERAKKMGYSALAVTDECSMAGIVRAPSRVTMRRPICSFSRAAPTRLAW